MKGGRRRILSTGNLHCCARVVCIKAWVARLSGGISCSMDLTSRRSFRSAKTLRQKGDLLVELLARICNHLGM